MKRFLVEVYTPIGEIEERARRAAAELSGPGPASRCPRPIFVPEDETCFYLLDATSSHAAARTIRRAGASPRRVSEAVGATPNGKDRR